MVATMTKDKIIEITMSAMRGTGGLLDPDKGRLGDDEYTQTIVIPTLLTRVPDDTDILTCADFADLQVRCCSICHTYHAHYEMRLEHLADGAAVWVCCAVLSALREEQPDHNAEEWVDLEEALGGGLRKKQR